MTTTVVNLNKTCLVLFVIKSAFWFYCWNNLERDYVVKNDVYFNLSEDYLSVYLNFPGRFLPKFALVQSRIYIFRNAERYIELYLYKAVSKVSL